MIFQKLASSQVDNTGTSCFQEASLATGNILRDVREETAVGRQCSVTGVEMDLVCDLLYLGRPSLPLLQQLRRISSPCFTCPISTLSEEVSTLQSHKQPHPGFCKVAKDLGEF